MYKAIIFDVGDTLVHYRPTKHEVIIKRLREIDIEIEADSAKRIDTKIELCIAEQIYSEINGSPRLGDDDFGNMIDNVILEDDTVKTSIFSDNQISDFYKSRYSFRQEKIVDDQTYKLLSDLKKNYSLGIVSNYSADLEQYLDRVKLSDYFSSIIISEKVGFEKPDVRIFEISLRELGYKPNECLYVGDHPFDVFGAMNAGMDVAWINNKYEQMPSYISYKPTYILRSLAEIVNIL